MMFYSEQIVDRRLDRRIQIVILEKIEFDLPNESNEYANVDNFRRSCFCGKKRIVLAVE